jgi:hypothetical protein
MYVNMYVCIYVCVYIGLYTYINDSMEQGPSPGADVRSVIQEFPASWKATFYCPLHKSLS